MMTTAGRDYDDVARVREATDIVAVIGQYVGLAPGGDNLKGVCPFHQDTKPSLTVSPAKQVYYCFGCGEGGDVFAFVMKMEGLSFGEALRKLAARAGITLSAGRRAGPEEKKRDRLSEVVAAAEEFYHANLRAATPYAEKARHYLAGRGVTPAALERWRLGLAPDEWDAFLKRAARAGFDVAELAAAGLAVPSKEGGGYYDRFRGRIIFPIWSASGQVVAFGGRILGEGEPKYLNSPNGPLYHKSMTLYGFYQNRGAIARARACVIVEGYLDLVGLAQVGVENVVATCGTALTDEAATVLVRHAAEFVLLFDGDDAGLRAARRALQPLLARGARVRVAVLPAGKDPFDVAGEGGAAEAIAGASDWVNFIIATAARLYSSDRVAAKLAVVRDTGPLIAAVPDEFERRFWRQQLTDRLGISVDEFKIGAGTKGSDADANALSADENLLRILLQYPDAVAEALAALELADVADERVRRILRAMGKLSAKGDFSVPALVGESDEEDAGYVAGLAVTEVCGEDGVRAAGLAVQAVKRRAFALRAADLKRRVAAGEGECGDDEIRAHVEDIKRHLGEKKTPGI